MVRDGCGLAWIESQPDGDRENGNGPQFGEERNEDALERSRHHVTDIEEDADAHEDQTGDQAVAEGQRVDRLQPVDLHDVHQFDRIGDQRIDEQRPHLLAFEEHHAGVDRRHAQPHRDHQQGFEDVLGAQIDQHKAEQHQEDAPEHDFRLRGRQCGDTLEQIEKMNAFHTLQSSRQAAGIVCPRIELQTTGTRRSCLWAWLKRWSAAADRPRPRHRVRPARASPDRRESR
jgi:hypothetical protein